MKKNILRMASIFLSFSLLFGVTACDRTSSRKADTISADDPYFSVQEIEIMRAKNNNTEIYVREVIPLIDAIGIMVETHEVPEYDYFYSEEIGPDYGDPPILGVMRQPDETTSPDEQDEQEDDRDFTDAVEEVERIYEDLYPDDLEDWDDIEDWDDMEDWDDWDDIEDWDDWSSGYEEIFLIFDLDGNLIGDFDMSSILSGVDYITSITTDKDGNLVVIAESYNSEFIVVTYDLSNEREISRYEIEFDDNVWPSSFAFDDEGYMYVSVYGMSGGEIIIFDPNGNLYFEITPTSRGVDYGSVYVIDGQAYIEGYEYSASQYKFDFYKINLDTQELEPTGDLTALMIYGPMITDGGIFYNKSGGVYTYDIETNREELLLSWNYTDLDMSVYSYGSMVPVSSEKIIIVEQSYNTYSQDADDEPKALTMAILTRENENPNAGKTILSIAGVGVYSNSALTQEVFEFNKNNTEYRIEMKDYLDDFDYAIFLESSYQEILLALGELSQKLYLDILNGEGPDIIITADSLSSLERFEAQGMLVDLYEYLDKDRDLQREDFIESVLSVYENDGKLYQFPTSFILQGWVGPVRHIGHRTGWTLGTFNEIMNNLPDGVMPVVNVTSQDLLSMVVSASMDQFVDFSKQSVDFNNDDFHMILEMSKAYGSDISDVQDGNYVIMYDDVYSDSSYIDEWELISTGRLALSSAYIYNPSAVADYRNSFGEDITFVGYPSALESGPVCVLNSSFAIASDSPNKDVAWSFVSVLISQKVQSPSSSYTYGSPVRIDAMEEVIELALNPEEDDYYYIMDGRWDSVNEDDIALYRELINSVSSRAEGDEQILAIIQEEAGAFFNDQKTVEEVARVIDNRVRTFVSERS